MDTKIAEWNVIQLLLKNNYHCNGDLFSTLEFKETFVPYQGKKKISFRADTHLICGGFLMKVSQMPRMVFLTHSN